MSTDFDRFLAGDGALADLIRRQPSFEPPAQLFERVMSALGTDAPTLAFEPPASLEAAVLAEAARLDAAQRPRRDALLDDIAHGSNVGDALGAGVSDATAQWLKTQAQNARTPAIPRQPPPTRPWRAWLNGLGVATVAALAASVALKVWFDPQAPSLSESDAIYEIAQAPKAIDTQPPAPASPPAVGAARQAEERAASASAFKAKPLAREMKRAAKPSTTARRAPTPQPADNAQAAVTRAGAPEALALPAPKPTPAAPATMADAATDTIAAGRADEPAAPLPARARLAHKAEGGAASIAPLAPGKTIDVPLATPAEALLERLAGEAPAAWQLIVAPADVERARAVAQTLEQGMQALGRADRFMLTTAERPAGSLRLVGEPLRADATESPALPRPRPAADDR